MSRVLESAAVKYPVLCVARGLWQVTRDPASLDRLAHHLGREVASGHSRLPALLVTADAQVHRLIRIEVSKDEHRLFRFVKRQPPSRPILECDGEPSTASVDQVHNWVALTASAAGNFESQMGFGLPSDLGRAKSVNEILDRLATLRPGFYV